MWKQQNQRGFAKHTEIPLQSALLTAPPKVEPISLPLWGGVEKRDGEGV